jgi:farnesol dehydrogenase
MKIFITGATSSIGIYLINSLIEKGHELILLVRSKTKAIYLEHKNIQLFEGDINDLSSLNSAMHECDQVYHLAAITKVWLKDVNEYFRVNVEGTNNVLLAAKSNNVKRVVITSSAGVYGPSENSKINEETIRKTDFFNEYESSKALAELCCKTFFIENKLDIVIVSPTRIYGPILHGPNSSTTLLIEKYLFDNWRILPGTGKELGNYVYIEDVIKGHILAMEKGKPGNTYILYGENCSYIHFFSILADISEIKRKMIKTPLIFQSIFANFQLFLAHFFGVSPTIVPKWLAKGLYNWEISTKKAHDDLGYSPTSLVEGLRKTVTFLRAKKV